MMMRVGALLRRTQLLYSCEQAGSRRVLGRIDMKLRLALLAAASLLVCAPVAAQDQNVEGRVVKLEKEMRAVQREVFPNGAGKFFEADIKPEDAKKTTVPSASAVTDLLARVDALETQLASLTGQVEQQGNSQRSIDTRLKSVESQLKAQAVAGNAETPPATTTSTASKPVAIAAKPAAAKPAIVAKPAAASKPSAARVAAVAAIAKPSTGDAFEDGYNYGYRLWELKYYPEAQTQLEETTTKFPKNKRISFARNLLGRAWLDDKKPATAVKIFYDNYKLDPRGERAPDSLYFLGVALTDLNKNTEACEAYGQLKEAYPDIASGRLSDRVTAGKARAKCK
jgi:TolA-binding protein